jgi:hypothetical protein
MPGILSDYLDTSSLRMASATSFGHAPDGNDAASAWTLLLGAASAEAFRHKLAMLNIETQRRVALHPSQRNADQPRTVASSTKTEADRPATSDAAPVSNPTSAPDIPPADKGAPSSPSK